MKAKPAKICRPQKSPPLGRFAHALIERLTLTVCREDLDRFAAEEI
jgi:hypothetical protein